MKTSLALLGALALGAPAFAEGTSAVPATCERLASSLSLPNTRVTASAPVAAGAL